MALKQVSMGKSRLESGGLDLGWRWVWAWFVLRWSVEGRGLRHVFWGLSGLLILGVINEMITAAYSTKTATTLKS